MANQNSGTLDTYWGQFLARSPSSIKQSFDKITELVDDLTLRWSSKLLVLRARPYELDIFEAKPLSESTLTFSFLLRLPLNDPHRPVMVPDAVYNSQAGELGISFVGKEGYSLCRLSKHLSLAAVHSLADGVVSNPCVMVWQNMFNVAYAHNKKVELARKTPTGIMRGVVQTNVPQELKDSQEGPRLFCPPESNFKYVYNVQSCKGSCGLYIDSIHSNYFDAVVKDKDSGVLWERYEIEGIQRGDVSSSPNARVIMLNDGTSKTNYWLYIFYWGLKTPSEANPTDANDPRIHYFRLALRDDGSLVRREASEIRSLTVEPWGRRSLDDPALSTLKSDRPFDVVVFGGRVWIFGVTDDGGLCLSCPVPKDAKLPSDFKNGWTINAPLVPQFSEGIRAESYTVATIPANFL